jgi:hypothetical protein
VRVYAAGSALRRALPVPAHSVDWQRWAEQHEPELLVTPLSLSVLESVLNGISAL